MDATVLKIRVDRVVKNIAVYIMLGITLEGKKEIIGIWIGENETSKYWLTVLNDIQKLFEVCIMERQKSKCVWSDLFMGYV